MKNYLYLFVSLFIFTSCLPENEVEEIVARDFIVENEADIQKYIQNNNLSPEKSSSGLYYIIESQGTGDVPLPNADVQVKIITSYLEDGKIKEVSQNQNNLIQTFNIEAAIDGLKEGILLLNQGGKAQLIISNALGFQNIRFNNIPEGSVLIMDIELVSSDIKKKNEADILKYIQDNTLDAQKTSSGLYYVITKSINDGDKPNSNSNVTVAYKGFLLDGTVFDESPVEGISFGLNQVIPGWTEGIPLFKKGEEGILLIPSHLGYGNAGIGSIIKGGDVLVFDINLIRIN